MRFFKKKAKLYPDAVDPTKVGTYDLHTFSGGGYFYDEVLEYRVWVKESGKSSKCHMFADYESAESFAKKTQYAEWPLVLVLQNEYVDEKSPGVFTHVKKARITEWQPDWLEDSQGTAERIPEFLRSNHTA